MDSGDKQQQQASSPGYEWRMNFTNIPAVPEGSYAIPRPWWAFWRVAGWVHISRVDKGHTLALWTLRKKVKGDVIGVVISAEGDLVSFYATASMPRLEWDNQVGGNSAYRKGIEAARWLNNYFSKGGIHHVRTGNNS